MLEFGEFIHIELYILYSGRKSQNPFKLNLRLFKYFKYIH